MPVPNRANATVLAVLLSLLATGGTSQAAEIETQAIAGEPFGVGRISIPLSPARYVFPDAPLQLAGREARVFYSAFDDAGIYDVGKRGAKPPEAIAAYFLFRGDQPLELTVQGAASHHATVTPVHDAAAHRALLETWWKHYTAAAQRVAQSDAYQPLVENYLTATLARRLKLPAPDNLAAPALWGGFDDHFFALVTGAESVRSAAQTDVLLEHDGTPETADRPIPKAASVPPVDLPRVHSGVAVEPIALHVPEECFYVRFGSFANFLWAKRAVDQWGTQIRQFASVRSLDYHIGSRIERQLALHETVLGTLFGGTVISDVAILGNDTFLREGASIGVLFEARNSKLLKDQIASLREEALDREKTATQQTIRIAGRDVSLVATPDNRVRSFYAIDGDYHLVTTSQTIVRRFFEAGGGKGSLGRLGEFRWARSLRPVAEDFAAFVYLSDPFFHRLIGPEYRIEMTRRVAAASEIDVVRVARLAAMAEGRPARSVPQLIAGGYLPAGFGRRPDGSRAVIAGRAVTDSLRGAYGSFLPVPDVEIRGATPSEVESYEQFAAQYADLWRRMDPVVVAVRRRDLDEQGTQRVTFDVHITPYARQTYDMLAMMLGAADKQHWAWVPGDVAALEVNFSGDKHRLALRDFAPRFRIEDGTVHLEENDRHPEHELYYVCRGAEANLFMSSMQNAPPPDEEGDAKVDWLLGSGDSWMRRLDGAMILAANKEILRAVAPRVKLVDAQRAAKGRLWIGDVRQCEAARLIDAEAFLLARKASAGNVQLMRTLTGQLHVPQKKARSTAEELLGAEFVCPLGGKYRFQSGGGWSSSAWKHESVYQIDAVADEFRAEVLDWFAGLLVELDIDQTALTTHIEIDLREEP